MASKKKVEQKDPIQKALDDVHKNINDALGNLKINISISPMEQENSGKKAKGKKK